MTPTVKGVPDGASVVIPRLFCRDPGAEVEFCATAFGAVEVIRRPGPQTAGPPMHWSRSGRRW